jgi:hypothetical protein
MCISRTTVRKYEKTAKQRGYLDVGVPLPDDATLFTALGVAASPSSVEPYAEIVEELLGQGVEMTAIYERLRDDRGYGGSYSSVRRYVHRKHAAEP